MLNYKLFVYNYRKRFHRLIFIWKLISIKESWNYVRYGNNGKHDD